MARGIVNVGKIPVIKSVQQIYMGLDPQTRTEDKTITEVDLNKAVIIFEGQNVQPGAALSHVVNIEFVNSTTVKITRSSNANYWTKLSFLVVEFEGVKSIQKGVMTLNAASNSVTITSVDTAKTLIFYGGYRSSGTTIQAAPYLYLYDATTLCAVRDNTTTLAYVSYMVVEFI